jgi:hypothetical protein
LNFPNFATEGTRWADVTGAIRRPHQPLHPVAALVEEDEEVARLRILVDRITDRASVQICEMLRSAS